MRKSSIFRAIGLALPLSLSVVAHGSTERVVLHPSPSEALSKRWAWAMDQKGVQDNALGFWVGYNIQKLMGIHSFTGRYSWPRERDETSLNEILFGIKIKDYTPEYSVESSLRETAQAALDDLDGKKKPEKKVLKDVAMLFHYAPYGSHGMRIQSVKISNMCLAVDLNGLPVIWLGRSESEESIRHLIQLFPEGHTHEVKKRLITSIGIHPPSDRAVSFLEKILKENESNDLRKHAAFWLGSQGTDKALSILTRAAEKDPSTEVRKQCVFAMTLFETEESFDALLRAANKNDRVEVRKQAVFWLGQSQKERALKELIAFARSDPSRRVQEQAVFAISQMKSEEAVDTLIDLAAQAPTGEIRKKAVFWLGQEASKKAVKALENVVYEGPELELQEHAVFALSELPGGEGIPYLIEISKNHPRLEVRKKAIFWLGESGDPRAVDVLTEIVRKR